MAGVAIGPTWRRGAAGGWDLPAFTLGWQVLGWTKKYLLQPDGPEAGAAWTFTPEQARFLLWWYAVDERGRFLYRRGMLRRMKGWGKDPLGAALAVVEFVGPCRFGGWERGQAQPKAVPHPAPWVVTAAVSQDQTRNTTTLLPGMVSKRALTEYGIELGKTVVYAQGGRARLDAVTSSPRAMEGMRPTFTLKNETHHWKAANEGLEMSAVIARNAAKSRDGSSRVLAISNAHNPGERTDAEADFEAYLKIASGRSVASGFLYDSLEAPPDTDMSVPDSLRAGLVAARGDSTWLDVDRLMEEILDPTTSPAMSRRFYLNQVVAAEDAWVAPHEWDACGIDGQAVRAKGIITLGFDGSKSDDTTALIGCRVEDGYLFEIGSWDPANYPSRDPDGVVRYEVPSAEIAGAVVKAFETYDVVGFLADVHPWESYIDAWEEAFGEGLCARATERRAIAFDMRQERAATLMVEQFHAAITEREVRHGREPGLSEHIYNARRRPNRVGISFAKESRFSSRKIDRAAAAALAWKARSLYLLLPEEKRRQEAKVAGVWFA
jgi:hypothetical protein